MTIAHRRRMVQLLERHPRWLIVGVATALLTALYVADVVSGAGRIGRNVVVAGVAVGGLDLAAAEQLLRATVGPRATRPVPVTAGELVTSLDPARTGLAVDWAATVARAAEQPVNPVARLWSSLVERESPVVTALARRRATSELESLARRVSRPPREGTVRFVGLEPTAVEPVTGQELDVIASLEVLETRWLGEGPVALPVVRTTPAVEAGALRKAIDEVARPAVASPVTLLAGTTRVVLSREAIATALRLRPGDGGRLVAELDADAVRQAVGPALTATEQPLRNASVGFEAGRPVATPAQDGRTVDHPATVRAILDRLGAAGEPREVTVAYRVEPASVGTEQLNRVLAAGEMSSFATRGFAPDSGKNIRRAAELINGKVVGPGETFSLNAATNPRDAAHGFVEAGIIEDGQPARGIGGGVSQIATTLYNAAYFAGMVDVAHKEHSYYISRYPVAREATVFNNVIDVKFRNDTGSAVVIQTIWTPTDITVKFHGPKAFEVTSKTGARTNPTEPEETTSDSPRCKPSTGTPGFTATDTRTLRDLRSGEVRTETRTVVYQPAPIVRCEDDED